jgi:aminomuconate-semialdehyde/2-hydroxymuconate-6-semialdehyde dehydrogenase
MVVHLDLLQVAPALAAGCTIVAKPSELTPSTASLLAEASQRCVPSPHIAFYCKSRSPSKYRAGLPAGVLNIVHGLGPSVGSPIVRHPSVAAVSFTGGTATGRMVASEAAPLFKKV